MNSSKIISMIAIIALIMLFIYPIESMPINDYSAKLPTRHKRWTFNTWRLHGRRQLSNDLYSSKPSLSSSDIDHQYPIFNDEDDVSRKIDEHLSQFFHELYRE